VRGRCHLVDNLVNPKAGWANSGPTLGHLRANAAYVHERLTLWHVRIPAAPSSLPGGFDWR